MPNTQTKPPPFDLTNIHLPPSLFYIKALAEPFLAEANITVKQILTRWDNLQNAMIWLEDEIKSSTNEINKVLLTLKI